MELKRSKLSRKGQLSLGDAPTVVMIVGLIFLTMATIALIGQKYGDALLTETTSTVTNETASANLTGYTVAGASSLGAENFVVVSAWADLYGLGVYNKTILNPTSNITISSAGVVTNATDDTDQTWNAIALTYTYDYTPRTDAYNATDSLQTEVSNNTSIAGIILTISLVGIVLAILIGVFMGIRRRQSRI